MEFKQVTLRGLTIHTDEHGDRLIIFNDFVQFLKKHIKPHEQSLKSSNIFGWLKGKGKCVKTINDQAAFNVQSIIHYFFAYANNYQICNSIVQEIQHLLISDTQISPNPVTVRDIYKEIGKSNVLDTVLKESPKELQFDTTTLNSDYEDYFSQNEWWTIRLFEHHFQRCHQIDVATTSYESLLMKKKIFFEKLAKVHETASEIGRYTHREIKHRNKRKGFAEEQEKISIQGKNQHNPLVIEQDISNLLDKSSVNDLVFCLDCTRQCQHPPSIHVYLEDTNTEQNTDSNKDLITQILSRIKKKHGEVCAEIVFFKKGTLESWNENCEKKRFEVRDELSSGGLKSSVEYVWKSVDMDNSESFEDYRQLCSYCFTCDELTPLSMKHFDILKEWYLETPLTIQILLSVFINKKTSVRADDTESYLLKKISRLYSHYDSLLNVSNQQYCGILQDINTKELAMNYQSISTVFGVTSGSGITQSIKTAEQNFKTMASNEKTYYNTYLKKYPIECSVSDKLITKYKCLRDCALVLMIDNLVRLKKRADPDPGESRSMQLCTLPITLRGVPLDSDDVGKWHTDQCDKAELCCCKKPIGQDIEEQYKYLLSLSDQENKIFDDFQKLAVIGHPRIWQKAIEENFLVVKENKPSTDLDISMASLTLDEDEVITGYGVSDVITDGENESDCNSDPALTNLEEIDLEQIEVLPVDDSDEFGLLDDSMIIGLIPEQSDDGLDTSDKDHGKEYENLERLLKGMGFIQFQCPPLLTKHPPPAIGRDDDMKKLKEVLDDILRKTDSCQNGSHKILFAPDHKIAVNLFKLKELSTKYDSFLPEFPCLHLRKSKITILCSAYKDAGLLHILKYIRDEECQEWKKLVSADHIEQATKYIRRISIALHIAFFVKYLQTLDIEKQEQIHNSLPLCEMTTAQWDDFNQFLKDGCEKNGTFALHHDIMIHCDEVSAIAFAERIGGRIGYKLLLAAVKSSLPFSFLNGASSYASFTTKLLLIYFECGPYYKEMKHALFSCPYYGGDINLALDTQREMDHKDALKAFRSGSTMSSIIPRMSLIDALNEVHENTAHTKRCTTKEKEPLDILGMQMSQTDTKYILKAVNLILRRDGISMEANKTIYNVYDVRNSCISETILDEKTKEAGRFLIKRYVYNLCSSTHASAAQPDATKVSCANELKQKLKQSKGITIKRTSVGSIKNTHSEWEKAESQRKKAVQREFKKIDCFSSAMNACQAILKPDCSKPKVLKSTGMRKALFNAVVDSVTETKPLGINSEQLLEQKDLIYLSKRLPPRHVTESASVGTIEFAGIKFKANSSSGRQYIKYIENAVLMKTKLTFPNISMLAVCEEKYQFTPDDFKAATRAQRHSKSRSCITHLKTDEEILNTETFDKRSITGSAEGRFLISTFFAKHLHEVKLKADLIVDVDSELYTNNCSCKSNPCNHPNRKYVNPVRASFSESVPTKIEILNDVKQTKGEAEMAQIDWLLQYQNLLKEGNSAVSIVSSGDIDAVVLHMFAVASLWPRSEESGKFKNEVFVILQKPGGLCDIYNITEILVTLENHWLDKYIGQKVSLLLSLGGNDFLPKFHGITHSTVLQTFLKDEELRLNLFKINKRVRGEPGLSMKIDVSTYKNLIKILYTPKRKDPKNYTYEEIRQMTIMPNKIKCTEDYRNPQTWMPPATAVEQLSKNVQCVIDYYLTAGIHETPMPDFLENGCLQKSKDGTIEYNLGPDSFIRSIKDILGAHYTGQNKRKQTDTPQKGARRKIKPKATSTPKKMKNPAEAHILTKQSEEESGDPE